VAAEGVAGLYHGLLPTLLRDVPDIAIQFALYERLRKALERRRQVSKLRTWEHLILGGFSGAFPPALPPAHNVLIGFSVSIIV
jgi:solute carrier family 25 S-adenosylmethionine transporter 26